MTWPELRSVAVHSGWTQARTRRYARVSLVLHGTDPGLFTRHPELRQVRDTRADGSTVRIPLTDRIELVEPLARGLAVFAGPRFGGVLDDGRVGNLSYGRPGDR